MNFFLAIIHSTETFTQFNIFSNYDIQPFYNLLLLFGVCVCMQVNQRKYLQITWNTFLSSQPMPASNFLSLKVVYYAAFEFFFPFEIDFFLMQYILGRVSTPSTLHSSSPPPLPAQSTPSLSLIRKEQATKI